MLDRIKKEVKTLLHRGNKYICPFCGYNAKDLSLIGFDYPVLMEKQVIGGGKRFGGCFRCKSSDRERLIYIYLKEKLHLLCGDKHERILHIAPEKNLTKILLAENFAEYTCGDKFTEGYSYPDHVQKLDILKLPFDDDYFDLIICNHVLEHINNDLDGMKELYRVLKKGGQAILQVPISKNSYETFEDFSVTNPNERELVFGQFDHLRIYGQDYVERLSQCGFVVDRINISKEYEKYGLNEDEDIFIGRK